MNRKQNHSFRRAGIILLLLLCGILLLTGCKKKPAANASSAAASPAVTATVTPAVTAQATTKPTGTTTPAATTTPAVTAAPAATTTPAVTAAPAATTAPTEVPEENEPAMSEAASSEEAASTAEEDADSDSAGEGSTTGLREDGEYTSKEDVAAYIHEYGRLPRNYITKKEAEKLGWQSNKGNLWEVAPGMSIGGSKFGNYEGNLPEAKGRKYYECDINYEGGYRGAERIVYSNDGLVFYTGDHYETWEQLY